VKRANSKILIPLAASLLAAGCMLGPDYRRPAQEVPPVYRFQTNPTPNSFADQGWWQVYEDPTLQALLSDALAHNLDVRIAATRIEQAAALLGSTRLQQLPQASVAFSAERARTSQYELLPGEPPIENVFSAQGSLSYEVDFWGKYRRATQAARAQLLSSEYARDDVTAGLITSVATAYFTLQSLDEQVDITNRTIDSRQKFVDLTQGEHDRGTVSGLDVASAQGQLAVAQASLPELQRQIATLEDQLSVLLGHSPGSILRDADGALKRMAGPSQPPVPPAGLPSSLLERRPDVREAEQNLVAANAQVGVAIANLFPTIDLTAAGGSLSTALSKLFTGPAGAWSIGGSILQPLLDPQRSLYQVDLADAQKAQAVLQYQQSVLTAFQEVSDALISRQKYAEVERALQFDVEAQRKADTIALARYRVGSASYFDVINADSALFTAELALSSANLNTLLSVVQLYRALGGGWQNRPSTDGKVPPNPTAGLN
jgi:outer membrane protein, multidrug efflux system